jgi:hypothetical protein
VKKLLTMLGVAAVIFVAVAVTRAVQATLAEGIEFDNDDEADDQ